MKKLIIALLFITVAHSQTTIHFYASSKLTTGSECLIDGKAGFGFSGAWDVKATIPGRITENQWKQEHTRFREEWCSLYGTASFGYLGPVLVKYRGGLAVYQDKVDFETYCKTDRIKYSPMIGISGMYSISDAVGIEIGCDTFNKLTAGITVLF